MGNSVSRVVGCFMPVGNEQERVGLVFSEPLDEDLGHSFCYVRPVIESARYSPSQSERFGIPDPSALEESHSRSFRLDESNPNPNGNPSTMFKAISGASVSANTSTPRTVAAPHDQALATFANAERASAFEGTSSFSALPLQPVPRGAGNASGNCCSHSGPMSGPLAGGPMQQPDRSFMSAPLERGGGFLSGPLERGGFLSGPLENVDRAQYFSAPLGGHVTFLRRRRRYFSRLMRTMSKPVRKALGRTQRSWVLQLIGWQHQNNSKGGKDGTGPYDSSGMFLGYPSEDNASSNNLQWAQGKAGEDRVHVVLSEEHGWLFVGIYDGFNGPDAPEFLMCHLYKAIFNELEGLLWDRKVEPTSGQTQEDAREGDLNPQDCPIRNPQKECHCPQAQSEPQVTSNHTQNRQSGEKDCPLGQSVQADPDQATKDCSYTQTTEQMNSTRTQNREAAKQDFAPMQSAPSVNPNDPRISDHIGDCSQGESNPIKSTSPEAEQEDWPHDAQSASQLKPSPVDNLEATQDSCPHSQSAPYSNDNHSQHSEGCPQAQTTSLPNPCHSHCPDAVHEDNAYVPTTVQHNLNEPQKQAAKSGQQNDNNLQDLEVNHAKLEIGDRGTSTSEQEKTTVNDRQHPSTEIDSKNPEIDVEVSICNAKVARNQGNPPPLTEFIKRVTFECEKKEVGECRKGRSLRELLAEEEDDPLDFFVWNSTTNIVDRARQNILRTTENSGSGSVAATVGETRSAMQDPAETREGNCASDQISDTRPRRVSYSDSEQKQGRGRSLLSSKLRQVCSRRKESHRKLFPLRYDWEKERIEVEKKLDERLKQDTQRCRAGSVDHVSVLKALSRALEVTEDAYLEMTDKVLDENPELALMGSCLLVMLMKDQDVYVMNVGDSRAIVAQQRPGRNSSATQHCSYHNNGDGQDRFGLRDSLVRSELEGITEEPATELASIEANTNANGAEVEIPVPGSNLIALQLSTDHSTSIEEEVLRIKAEHPDDNQSILNDRVKGRLKVTRAFGAGFLKQPKWNNALLEMFRNDYVGTAPYITCIPSLRHHRLGPNDQFLVLSSDGLYQYLTNQEVVSHVELFMEKFPDGDPAQHLIEELLFRAAKKAGMDFHELLDIPQGDRRKYHDDVSVMVISLEGRIWRSSDKYI